MLRVLMVFSVMFFTQLGISALVDPEVGAKLRERLERRQARHKARRELLERRRELLERRDEEATRRLKEAWRELIGREKDDAVRKP